MVLKKDLRKNELPIAEDFLKKNQAKINFGTIRACTINKRTTILDNQS